MKKFFSILLCLLFLGSASIFVACHNDSGNTPIDPETPIDWDTIDWEGNNDTSTNIRVVFSTHFKSYYENLINEFEAEYSEYTVEPIWAAAGDGVQQQQNSLIGGNDAPDLIVGGDVHILSQSGLLLPLNKLVERDDAEVDFDDFIPQTIEPLYYGEGLYYLPDYFNVGLLYYNKDIFDEAGIPYPDSTWTFDKYMEVAKQLTKTETKDGVTRYTQWGGDFDMTWGSQWVTLVRQYGGEVFNEEGFLTLNTAEAKAAFQAYIDMVGVTQQPDTWDKKIAAGPSDDNLGGFEGRKTAMVYGGHTGTMEAFNSIALLDWDVELLPIGPNGTRNGGEFAVDGYGIYKNSKNKKGSWELLKFMTRKRDEQEMREFNWPSPRISGRDILLAQDPEDRRSPQNLEAVYGAVEYAETLPRIEYYTDIVLNRIDPYITRILEGKLNVNDALDEMTSVANDYISNTYVF